ncbi:MAG: pirin family protein [Prevotella sp.]|jgi:redox-sensitive bicupin YhaK (pirin superfamily)
MDTKKIETIVSPVETHWVGDGFRVHNFIPGPENMPLAEMDPFILLDYNSPLEVKASNTVHGVGAHPHRGFETVTLDYQGGVEHHDSAGSHGVIHPGDVQWMTAAGGVLHKEYYEKAWARKGGTFQMVQLWVNLPAENKMDKPSYQSITHDQMGVKDLGEGSRVEVIAGEYQGVKGPAKTHTPVSLMNAVLKAGAKATFDFPKQWNTALLVVKGSVEVNGVAVATDHFLKFGNEGTQFEVTASEDAVVLVMSGQPLHEPFAAYGPFVMNTKQQIYQAFDDFKQGKFGELDD